MQRDRLFVSGLCFIERACAVMGTAQQIVNTPFIWKSLRGRNQYRNGLFVTAGIDELLCFGDRI